MMEQSDYDKKLVKWVKNHHWDSLEKDKDLILRHLRTFAGDQTIAPERRCECGVWQADKYCGACGKLL